MSAISASRATVAYQPTAPIGSKAVAPNLAVTAVFTANRQAMPQVAAAIDQLRAIFGPVRVIHAVEAGQELGQEPPPGVIAHPPHVPCPSKVKRQRREVAL